MGSWDDMLNPAPVATWNGATPPAAAAASPYGGLTPVGPDYQTTFGPNTPNYDPYRYPGQPEENLGTTYTNQYTGQPALDPRARQSMSDMDYDEKKRQEARCPSCVAKKEKDKEARARANSCANHVGAAAGLGAVGGALGGPEAAGAGAVGAGGYAWLSTPDCWDGVHDPLQALSGVK